MDEDRFSSLPPPSYGSEPEHPPLADASAALASLAAGSNALTSGQAQLHPNRSVLGLQRQSLPPSALVVPTTLPMSQPPEASQSTSSLPFGSPPGYRSASRPTGPVTYTFSPINAASMLLLPPADAADSRPRYHISFSQNCFCPFSYITTIRRGATEYGEFVADFEMGLPDMASTVCVKDREAVLDNVLTKGPRQGWWDWTTASTAIRWDCSQNVHTCYKLIPRIILARFTPPMELRRPGLPSKVTKLEILPEGYDTFDYILISALVLEQKRLMCGGVKKKK